MALLELSFPGRALANPIQPSNLESMLFQEPATYEERRFHSLDGTGRFFLDREIAETMGHEGAPWLERSVRAIEEQPHKLVHALNLRPTDVVADIGAGSGYISFRLSALVPEGKVIAVDIQPEMLEMIERTKADRGFTNIETILGEPTNPHLPPASIDLALMVDAYHEFAYPQEMMQEIITALKPEGRVALVEYRAEDPFVFIKPLHKMSEAQVKKEMQAIGLEWQETKNLLPQQHLMLFQKRQIN